MRVEPGDETSADRGRGHAADGGVICASDFVAAVVVEESGAGAEEVALPGGRGGGAVDHAVEDRGRHERAVEEGRVGVVGHGRLSL